MPSQHVAVQPRDGPLIRWMQSRVILRGDLLRAYADDFGFGLMNFFASLPRLSLAFAAIGRGTGLFLRIDKCILVPFFPSVLTVAAHFLLHSDGWNLCSAGLAGKYLGFFLGPAAPDHVWLRPLARCARIALQIRAEGLGLVRSALLFNQRAAAMMSFVAQLFIPPQKVLLRYSHIAQSITRMPYNTFTSRILFQGRDCGLGYEVIPLNLLSLAARFRLSVSSEVRDVVSEIDEMRFGDGLLAARLPVWRADHVGPLSCEQVHEARSDPLLQHLRHHSPERIQAAAFRVLRRDRAREPLVAYIGTRTRRWLDLATDGAVELCLSRLSSISQAGHAHLSTTVLRTLLRGWCTSSRLGIRRDAPCIFGCGGVDKIEHMMACPALWCTSLLDLLLPLGLPPSCAERTYALLLLSPRPARFADRPLWDVACACILDAVHFAFNQRRRGCSPDATPFALIRARLAELSRRSSRLRWALEF